jgi:hypothetical protein
LSDSKWKPLWGAHGQWEYNWINAPPLVEADADAVAEAVAQMKQSVRSFDEGDLPEYDDDDYEIIEHAVKWNTRVKSTRRILKITEAGDYNLIYTVLGTVVGIICLDIRQPTYVSRLVTHPGTENAGGILVEAAVAYSQTHGQEGYKGKLELQSFNDESTAAYKAMGFVTTHGDHMELDPANSDLWERGTDGSWKLKKYADKKYYVTRDKPPPTRPTRRLPVPNKPLPPPPEKGT